VRDLLPRGILTRRKMGFPVPFGTWMRNGWEGVARDVLLDRRSRERGLINHASVEQLILQHARGVTDASESLWGLLNLELWYRTFIDGEGVQTLSTGAAPRWKASPVAEATA